MFIPSATSRRARDAEGLIGEGIHIRYIVDREKFMAKVK